MPLSRTVPLRPDLADGESTRPARISGGDIMAAWLGVLLINAAVLVATCLR